MTVVFAAFAIGAAVGCSGLLGADFDRPGGSDAAGDAGGDVAVVHPSDATFDTGPEETGSLDAPTPDSASGCDGCNDGPPTCGAYGQSCCDNSACGAGLLCVSASCVGKVLLYGGKGGTSASPTYLNDAWEWDGSSWSPIPSGPPAAGWPMGASLGGKVYVYGGYNPENDGTDWDSMYAWDGSSWKQVTTSTPPARNAGMMGSTGSEIVLFGGLGATILGDTWVFDGTSWSSKSGGERPDPRNGATGAGFGTGLTMFGGYTLDDGGAVRLFGGPWQWNGQGWNTVTRDGGASPSDRAGAAIATYKGQLVVYGGTDLNGAAYDDVWTWDGSTWTSLGDAGIGGLNDPGMAEFDGKLVVFGGFDLTGNPTSSTWLYDGSTWSKSPASGPPARAGTVMVSR